MLRHPLDIDPAECAASYAKKSERVLGQLLVSNTEVIRSDTSTWRAVRESSVKRQLILKELQERAWAEECERRTALIARYAVLGTSELERLEGKIQRLIGQCDHEAAIRWIYREKLHLVRAEIRHRESGRDELPERDECGPEYDD